MAVASTKLSSGVKSGLKGRHFAEYKMVLSGGSTSGTLDDLGWTKITCCEITPTGSPTGGYEWWFDGTDLHFAGLAANDTFYLYVHGDRG